MVQYAVTLKDGDWTIFQDGKPIEHDLTRSAAIQLAKIAALISGVASIHRSRNVPETSIRHLHSNRAIVPPSRVACGQAGEGRTCYAQYSVVGELKIVDTAIRMGYECRRRDRLHMRW